MLCNKTRGGGIPRKRLRVDLCGDIAYLLLFFRIVNLDLKSIQYKREFLFPKTLVGIFFFCYFLYISLLSFENIIRLIGNEH